MEFMAIVDAKARTPSGCAVVGIYENGDLGVAARQIDKQLQGLITGLHGSGDFAAKLADTLMLPLPSGANVSRLLLIGLGTRASFGRKQYRKALLASAQGLAKTGTADAVVYLALEPVGDLGRRHQPRDRQERELRGRDLLGHLPQPADRQLEREEQLGFCPD